MSKKKKEEIKTLEAKLERAYHLRDFEIEMYWKRAQYFWGFLAVIYAGYFLLLTYEGKKNLQAEYTLLTCSIGAIMSFAWYLVNRGSKRWQEHWEMMINKYETLLNFEVYNEKTTIDSGFLKAGKFSVSRVNIIVSVIVFISWIGLYLITIVSNFISNYSHILIGFFTLISLILLYIFSKSKN